MKKVAVIFPVVFCLLLIGGCATRSEDPVVYIDGPVHPAHQKLIDDMRKGGNEKG
jgi:hypothetical protein